MIAEVVPAGLTGWAERYGDDAPDDLYPQEAAVVARAVAKRRREFATGRWLARQALGRIGVPPGPILPGERGAPGWPPGIVGSITHCPGYAAAVVGRRDRVATIGVDAEPDEALPDGVLGEISLPAERDRLARLEPGGVHWERLLFCVKEAVYKAWFPLTQRWLDFTEADAELRPDGTFEVKLLVDGPVSGFAGRWRAERKFLVAAIVTASDDAGSGR
ncbi:4'-phosphopantetheinyl transferase superfamily protein [Actinoplanes sp. TRM 88003]|uniref:4'-phosphopantetheinyl transferase superfamily protein n=1 Tax=Paractinoplanes aksuensis TaxID=2939490 RepID=A0ABT1DGG8_9ACTN|nr:4'-phosphopantetheinyl transferase superfamily protein [Actinoplanes aksuensis]MCO8269166.1 4'-phosphopantetheinyl transferase superfamily protein [Actinoplanes aksuensis]